MHSVSLEATGPIRDQGGLHLVRKRVTKRMGTEGDGVGESQGQRLPWAAELLLRVCSHGAKAIVISEQMH